MTNSQKTVLFVPGFQEDIDSRDYRATIEAIENKGYRVVFVPMQWSRTTIEDWVKELDEIYETHDPSNTILAGFSYGSMTAFMSATKRNPSELWLFSLSPYFAEDLKSKRMPETWLKNMGHRRVTTFGKLNFEKLASSISCNVLLFAGQLEMNAWPILADRVTIASKLLQNVTFTIVPNVGHDVADPRYIAAITTAI